MAKVSLRDPPDWFNLELVASWNHVLDHAPRGLLKEIDRSLLTSWVVAEHIHKSATKKLLASPLLIKASNGAVQSPFLGIINRQVVLMKALAAEFGFSPAARTRIAIEPDDEPDPADRFFGPK